MTSIKWPTTATGAQTGLTSGLSGGLRTDGQGTGSAGVSASARVLAEYQQADAGARRLRLGNALVTNLEGALKRLQDSAQAFAWPTQGVPFAVNSRLAAQPAASTSDLGVSLPDAANVFQTDTHLSRGFTASAPTTLDPGTYTMKLGFGGQTEKLSVSVNKGDTNADVLQSVADAVNGSTLHVGAQVRSQTGVGVLGPGVLPTGSFLALSADRVSADQTPTLTDTSGHLAAALKLSPTSTPLAPAQTGTHQLTSQSVARPTTFRTGGYDAGAATTLSPGTYTVGYAVGPAPGGGSSGSVLSGSVNVVVRAGDTWGDVLAHMKSAFGSASPSMVAQLVPARRVWNSATDETRAVVDALGLEIGLSAPKTGWRLTLSGGNLSSGGSTGGSGAGNILSAMGLGATAQPGSDGTMTIDGRSQTSATGAFRADQGRVAFTQSGTFGEVVPVSVLAPLDLMARGLSDVVTAYNDLRGLLTKNADLLRTPLGATGLAEDWRAPVSDRALDLKDLGLAETGKDHLLWLQADSFVQALTDNPQGVRSALLGDGTSTGLLPELAQKAQDALDKGAGSLLLPQSAFPARDPFAASPTPRTEADLEKRSQLLDLLDSASGLASGLAVDQQAGRAGDTLSGLAQTRTAEPYSWGGAGSLLRRKG